MALKQTSSSVNVVKFGPVGTSKHDNCSWDDQMGGEGVCALVQIFISFGSELCSLQFQFLKNGKHVLSEKHGGDGGKKYRAICFDYPREYLTSISGSFNVNQITSITFATNLTTYGPFGDSKYNSSFEFNLGNPSQFYGFFGTADRYIRSIGLYINPFSSIQRGELDSGSRGFSRENFELPGNYRE